MIIGIGTDILNLKTIRPSVQDPEDSFVRKTYTEKERSLIASRPLPVYSYATRFAGKEAVFKSLNTDGDALRLNEIEILENENGQPTVHLHGRAAALAKEKGISHIFISLSYDTDYATAFAVAVSRQDSVG